MKNNILITGGLGFIGFNLAKTLANLGYNIFIIDSCDKRSGYNKFHLKTLNRYKNISIIKDTISNILFYKKQLKQINYIFNLAGLIAHNDSIEKPLEDIEQNTIEHIKFLNAIKEFDFDKIIYTSTRQIYGKQKMLPVSEKQCVNPIDINGINKYTTELYHKVFSEIFDFNLIILRITNVYGPAMHIRDNRLSFIGWFFNRVLTNNEIEIFGSGEQKRDMLYIDELIDIMIKAINIDFTGIVNIGGYEAITLNRIANILKQYNNDLSIIKKAFPEQRKKIDIGDFQTDNTLAKHIFNFAPKIDIETGIYKTLEYFEQYKEYYL